jgi:hypothetical protein
MTPRFNQFRLALALAGILALTAVPAAQAHRGSNAVLKAHILKTNYGGHCGNGALSWCGYEAAPTITGVASAHQSYFSGYFQERRRGGATLWGCFAYGKINYHGGAITKYSERCYRI